jgi:hypothetical protein
MRFAAILVLSALMVSCNGNNNTTVSGTNSGPDNPGSDNGGNTLAILNGETLASATTHWVSQACNVQVELTSDGGAWSIVVDPSGARSSVAHNWVAGPYPDSAKIGPGSTVAGISWISSLTNITGSTSAKSLSADVTVQNTTSSRGLGNCSFTLQPGGLS